MRWALILIAFLLVSCGPVPAQPTDAIAALKTACNAACASAQEVTVTIPSGYALRSDVDGLCLAKGNRVFCGTCDCDTYGLADATLVEAGTERAVTCTFDGTDGAALRASCG